MYRYELFMCVPFQILAPTYINQHTFYVTNCGIHPRAAELSFCSSSHYEQLATTLNKLVVVISAVVRPGTTKHNESSYKKQGYC